MPNPIPMPTCYVYTVTLAKLRGKLFALQMSICDREYTPAAAELYELIVAISQRLA